MRAMYKNSTLPLIIFMMAIMFVLLTESQEKQKVEILREFAAQGARFTLEQGCELDDRLEALHGALGEPYERVVPRDTCNGKTSDHNLDLE